MVASNEREDGAGPTAPAEFDEAEIDRIQDFLASKGGVMLIAELRAGPKRFVELRDDFGISGSTVRDRIDDAKDLGLVVSDEAAYNEKGQKIHPLTPKGQVIADELQLTDLARIQREIWRLEAEFDDEIEGFGTALKQKTAALNEEILTHLRDTF